MLGAIEQGAGNSIACLTAKLDRRGISANNFDVFLE
jgi:hypothetical protein